METRAVVDEPKYFMGSEVRDGKLFAQNMLGHVEDRYETAYNLGCGDKHWDKPWINVDGFDPSADLICDLRRLSIPSDSADAVAAIHVVEHFYVWEVFDLLTEWKRVLKPGGKMILELPCMDKVFGYVAGCLRTKTPMQPFMTLLAMYGDPKHKDPAMCHKWGFFTEELKRLLSDVGMREITVCEPRYHFRFRDMRVESIK